MKVVSWNIRGLSSLHKENTMKDLICMENLDVLLI